MIGELMLSTSRFIEETRVSDLSLPIAHIGLFWMSMLWVFPLAFPWQFVLYIGAKKGRIPAHDNTIWIGTENDYFHHATRPPGTSLRIAHCHLWQTRMGSGLRPAGRSRRHYPFTTHL